MTVKIRGFKKTDLPNLLALLKQTSGEERLSYMHYYNGDFLIWLDERQIEVLVAEINGEVVGSAAYSDGYWGEEIVWLLLDETGDWGPVGDTLVREAEKYVKRGSVFTAIVAGSKRAEEWVQRGYSPNQGLYIMVASLSDLKSTPVVPEGTILRCLEPQEEKEFVAVVNEGFGWERVKLGDIQKWKTDSSPFNERWVQVAEKNGKLVSVVVAKLDVGYNKFFNAKRGYLGPATTLKQYRRENLASALTLQAMTFLSQQGLDSVCLFTSETNAAAVKLLENIGFRITYNWKFMHKQF